MFILADRVKDETYDGILEWTNGYPVEVKRSAAGSEAGSFKLLLDEAMTSNLSSSECVQFLEDDYIYRPKARELTEDGLFFGDYMTLRCHPDKYVAPWRGGNPLVDEKGGETTKVYLGVDSFWQITNSVGMQFATTMKVLREDIDIWYKCVAGTASKDFDCWLELRDKGRILVMPLPTGMSHDELESASPLIGTGLCCWAFALHNSCEHKC